MKRMLITMNVGALVSLLLAAISPAAAKTFDVGGRPLNVVGYISQTVQVSTLGDHWNSKRWFNQALNTVFVEGDYSPARNVGFYAGVGLTQDLAYYILDNDDEWNRKGFDESDELAVDDEWWQIVKEAHITWSSGDFFIRVGKQRVSWGEMDFFGVNDTINPLDFSRGLAEVEIESLVIPIPLLRVDYAIPPIPSSAESMGFFENMVAQFVFNPNADHIPDNGEAFGNDAAGIWAVDFPYYDIFDAGIGYIDAYTLDLATDLLDPTGELNLEEQLLEAWEPSRQKSRLGRQDLVLDEPDAFDSDFFEYGFRLSSTIGSSLFSIMYFYGRENTPLTSLGEAFAADSFLSTDDQGRVIITLADRGFYPRQKFLGVAWAGALPIRISALGGVEPVLRLEAKYQFGKKYFNFNKWFEQFVFQSASNFKSSIVESDYFVGGINFEFKIKAPWQRTYFFFLCEANFNDIRGYDDDWGLENVGIPRKSWWNTAVVAQTGYFRSKLMPSLVWFSQNSGDVQLFTPGIQYVYNSSLSFWLKYNHFFGSLKPVGGLSQPLYNNKDNILFKVVYQWG